MLLTLCFIPQVARVYEIDLLAVNPTLTFRFCHIAMNRNPLLSAPIKKQPNHKSKNEDCFKTAIMIRNNYNNAIFMYINWVIHVHFLIWRQMLHKLWKPTVNLNPSFVWIGCVRERTELILVIPKQNRRKRRVARAFLPVMGNYEICVQRDSLPSCSYIRCVCVCITM